MRRIIRIRTVFTSPLNPLSMRWRGDLLAVVLPLSAGWRGGRGVRLISGISAMIFKKHFYATTGRSKRRPYKIAIVTGLFCIMEPSAILLTAITNN